MNNVCRHIARCTASVIALFAFTACGGAGSPPPVGGAGSRGTDYGGTSVGTEIWPNTIYTVGGTVSGLAGQGLTIELLNLANLAHHTTVLEQIDIVANGAFIFRMPPSQNYGVAIIHQPHSPTQRCVVRNGQGVIGTANVTNVGIVCGEFAYVTNSRDNTISAFGVDATTGAIASAGPPAPAGLLPYAIASAPDKKHLYIGNVASNDISVFAIDSSSGALTAVPGSPFGTGTNPRGLALYSAVTQGYGSPPHIEWYLYIANAGSNGMSIYHVDKSTGLPTPLSPTSYATGTGPSALAIQPSGSFLYSANAGGSSDISGFQIDNYSGTLTPLAGSPFISGSSISSLAFGVSGKFLYAANATDGAASIYGFSVDQGGGALTPLPDSPYSLPSCNYIVADQTGTYLYAAVGTNIIGYVIDRNTGALSARAGFPIAVGGTVQSVSIDPTNQFLYVGNGSAATVTGFKLNEATGGLTPMPGTPFAVGGSPNLIATF